jgi:Sec-independent protein translocase protein TatA
MPKQTVEPQSNAGSSAMRIPSSGPLSNLAQSVQRQFTAVEPSPEEVREGLRVSLSELGKSMSAKPDKNEDIDKSELPQAIKDLLKMIRELRAQIAEKQAQIDAIMSDQSLDAEAKRQQIEGLQTELASLNSALTTANANLIKLMRENGLSSEQMQAATALAMS